MRAILLALLLIPSVPALAYDFEKGDLRLKVEPITGFEWVQKIQPTPHTKGRILYGVRAVGGLPMVSIEAEYTHATDQENFVSPSLEVRDTDEKVKIGLRSERSFGEFGSANGRAGVQARKNKHEVTQGGATTISNPPTEYDPYLGAGANLRLADKMELTFGLVVVIPDIEHMSQNEYQTTLGLSVRVP
ncbi:MAG TPA: hypothetical protein VM598_02970 [Bdellovibrionota bacterium]|nr:hypothetical protein [Bdellovibrionota bacterium]